MRETWGNAGPPPGLPEPVQPLRPLSGRQHAFWILDQLLPQSPVSNLVVAFRTRSPLRWWPLHAALNHLVARHPALRTRFPVAAGVPLVHVGPASHAQLAVDVGASDEAGLGDVLAERAWKPFDLETELPLRLFLCQVREGGSAVLLVVHHIVTDGGSLAVLVEELAQAYDALAAGLGIPAELEAVLPPAPTPAPRAEDLAYWVEQLRDAPASAALPGARRPAGPPTFAGATMARPVGADAAAAVESLRRAVGTTENLVLLTAWYLVLMRHGAGTDLVMGVPVSGRDGNAGTGIGFEVSTLPLRVMLDPSESFRAASRRIRDVFLAGIRHASASVEEVLAEMGHRSPDWRVPVFRYMYNYRPWDEGDVTIGGERPESLEVFRQDSRLDVNLVVVAGRQPPVLLTNYSTELFDADHVVTLLDRMESLLVAAAAEPERSVGDLDVATPGERALVAAANATRRDELPRRSVPESILVAARASPTGVAVVEDGLDTDYPQLLATAREVRDGLRALGVGSGDVVALALPRGAALAAAMMGVWGAGAAYLPLDATHPRSRLATQVVDAGARVAVTGAAQGTSDVLGPQTRLLSWQHLLDAGRAGGAGTSDDDWRVPSWDDPAYLMYTSGSTGQPRGVVVTHRNLANLVADFADRLGVTDQDCVLWSTTTAFDISGLEVFLPLTVGATVVVADDGTRSRPRDLFELVTKHDVTVVQATPTFWRLAVGEDPGDALRGRTVLCGGEPLSASLARDLLATGCRLFNVYGPTETTIWSTVARIGAEDPEGARLTDPVPVGTPISNTQVFVCDERGAELPPGLLGELCIAGAGVAAGYHARPDLTRDRFRSSPERGRYYRTGDLARWRADGTVELFGRDDRQVKLRGHRIELPEIEAALRLHDAVVDAAVEVVGDPQGDGELRAFVRPAPGVTGAGLPDLLWQHLAGLLPSYALPSRVTCVEEFPVTPNGKIDHDALRRLEVAAAPSVSPHPAQEGPDGDPDLTRRLLDLWRATLARPDLGERDHFFLNGGHSLLAVQLAGRVADLLGTEVDVRTIFDHPTARRLSARLGRDGASW